MIAAAVASKCSAVHAAVLKLPASQSVHVNGLELDSMLRQCATRAAVTHSMSEG